LDSSWWSFLHGASHQFIKPLFDKSIDYPDCVSLEITAFCVKVPVDSRRNCVTRLSTKIDVFGAFQSLLVPNAIEAIRELRSSSRPSPNAPVQLADIMDRALTGTAEDLLERELGDQRERWKNRVTFRHWRGTPDCPACEWTRFDEEQMHRA